MRNLCGVDLGRCEDNTTYLVDLIRKMRGGADLVGVEVDGVRGKLYECAKEIIGICSDAESRRGEARVNLDGSALSDELTAIGLEEHVKIFAVSCDVRSLCNSFGVCGDGVSCEPEDSLGSSDNAVDDDFEMSVYDFEAADYT